MANPSSSNNGRMVVVPHRPYLKVAIAGLFVVGLLGAGFLGFWFGGQHMHSLTASQQQQLAELGSSFQDCQETTEQLRFTVANLRLSSQLHQAAAEEVRSDVVALESQLATVEEDVSFYKGLLSPSEVNRGLSVGSLSLKSLPSGDLKYKVVLQQAAVKHTLLRGKLKISISGLKDGSAVTHPIGDLDDNVTGGTIEFGFRYFQVFEGVIKLPEGFSPVGIDVSAVTRGKKSQKTSRRFDWVLEPEE